MPKRALVVTELPPEIKAELDDRLISSSFSGYVQLSDWLKEKGFEISKSSLHRYGQAFEIRLSAIKLATEQARAVASSVKDDEGAMNEALIRLIQEKAFGALVESSQEDMFEHLPKLGRMVADLTRASVSQKKWAEEVRAKAEAAADTVVREARKAGLSSEIVELMKSTVLGVAT